MIETIYNGENNEEEPVKIPKNIHQIGDGEGKYHIYIEDKVTEFLKLLPENEKNIRYGILLGNARFSRGEVYLFIHSVVEVRDMLDNTLLFGDDVWTGIYDEIKKYYHSEKIVGWYYSAQNFKERDLFHMRKMHLDHFAGNDKVLYIMDALEGEDAFYMVEGEYLHKQPGYYIYYARNEAMQNFMIEEKREKGLDVPNEVEEKDEAVIRNYKKILEDRAHNVKIERINRRLSVVCSGLTVAVLALGVAVFSNYQMLEILQSKLVENGIITYVELENGYPQVTESEKDTQEPSTEEDNTREEMLQSTKMAAASGLDRKQENEEITVDKAEKTSAQVLPQYYVVQNGDTLSSISFKMYNSVGYVAELMEANEFSNSDDIHEGDTILIPTVASREEGN